MQPLEPCGAYRAPCLELVVQAWGCGVDMHCCWTEQQRHLQHGPHRLGKMPPLRWARWT